MDDLNWETEEVINHLINDEYCYNALTDENAEDIETFVLTEQAPPELYASFTRERSTFDAVNWRQVEYYLQG